MRGLAPRHRDRARSSFLAPRVPHGVRDPARRAHARRHRAARRAPPLAQLGAAGVRARAGLVRPPGDRRRAHPPPARDLRCPHGVEVAPVPRADRRPHPRGRGADAPARSTRGSSSRWWSPRSRCSRSACSAVTRTCSTPPGPRRRRDLLDARQQQRPRRGVRARLPRRPRVRARGRDEDAGASLLWTGTALRARARADLPLPRRRSSRPRPGSPSTEPSGSRDRRNDRKARSLALRGRPRRRGRRRDLPRAACRRPAPATGSGRSSRRRRRRTSVRLSVWGGTVDLVKETLPVGSGTRAVRGGVPSAPARRRMGPLGSRHAGRQPAPGVPLGPERGGRARALWRCSCSSWSPSAGRPGPTTASRTG